MRNYWQLQRWFQSQEVQKHQFYQNQRVYFIHNSEDFSPLETRYRSSVDGLQKESDGGSALLLFRSSAFPFFKRRPPRCFWTLFAFSDPHSFVHRPDTVSLRTSGWKMCCGILVNGLFLKRQSLLWVEHNKHTPGWRSISWLLRQRRLFFFRYKSFDFLAVSQVSSKLSRLSYGPVSVFFPSSSIWQNPLRTTALLQNDWLHPLLFGNVETARGDPSFAAAQSFDVAVISLRVVRVLRRTKRHHLRPPSPSCDGEFK